MSCFMCKGSLDNKLSTFMIDVGNCIVIVKNVPSQVCSQCGEVSYCSDVAKQLEAIINGMRNAVTEIAVVNFDNMVA